MKKKEKTKTLQFELDGLEEVRAPAPAPKQPAPKAKAAAIPSAPTAPAKAEKPAAAEAPRRLPNQIPQAFRESPEAPKAAPKVWIQERRDDGWFGKLRRWWVGLTKTSTPTPSGGEGEDS